MEADIQKYVDEAIAKATGFTTRKNGDIPTDSLHLANKAYVDRKTMYLKISDDATTFTVGDSFFQFNIPAVLDGATLYEAHAAVTTVSSLGVITLQVRNTAGDMLTTGITIDVIEASSYTAAIPAVVSATNFAVSKGEEIHIDIDGAGTGAKGLQIYLSFK